MAEETWQFSPSRLRGHRERLGWSRAALATKCNVSRDQIKSVEYGKSKPSLALYLSAAGSLGISPTELCRRHKDDRVEYEEGYQWRPRPTTPS